MSQQRLIWIDLAKGIGISLVVIGHAGRGLMSAAIPDEMQILPLLDGAIYAFHMPLFFILSGVTIGLRPIASIQPDLSRRIWRIFYPLTRLIHQQWHEGLAGVAQAFALL